MPKIQIIEKDLSWYYRQREEGAVCVYVPGLATFGPTEPTLCDSTNFTKLFGTSSVNAEGDLSYNMAASYIKSGMDVLFHRFIPVSAEKATSDLATLRFADPLTEEVTVTVDGESLTFKPDTTYSYTDFEYAKKVSKALAESGHDNSLDYTVAAPAVLPAPPEAIKTYTVVFSVAEAVTITVDGESITFEPGQENPTYEDQEYATKVSEALTALNIENSIQTNTVEPEDTSLDNHVTIKAKYEGSYGNTFRVKVKGTGYSRTFYVYNISGNLVETFVMDFNDTQSENYYSVVNSATNFIEVELTGKFDPTWEFATGEMGTDGRFKGIALSGGSDGKTETKTEEVDGEQVTTEKTVIDQIVEAMSTPAAFDLLKDPYMYDFDIITNGGFTDLKSDEYTIVSKIDAALRELAEARGTAIYLVDGHPEWDAESFFSYCNNFNTSYCAAFGPWSYAQFVSNGVTALLPGSYCLLVSWANSIAVGNPVWMAPAGVKRATLGSFYKYPKYPIGSTILDMWQNQDYVAGETSVYKVNPIMRLKSFGYVIYGNSTLYQSNNGWTSMLQSFSTRVMANMIKSHAFDVSLNLQFDQITDDLFAQFKTLMGVFMDQLKYQGALYDYEIVVDRSTVTEADLNTRTVPVRIMISPNPAAENFIINLEIARAGITFNDDTDETEVDR